MYVHMVKNGKGRLCTFPLVDVGCKYLLLKTVGGWCPSERRFRGSWGPTRVEKFHRPRSRHATGNIVERRKFDF